MLTVAYESSGQPLPQASEEGHSRSSSVLCDIPRLLMVTVVILSTRLQNCNADYLLYVTNLIPKLVEDATSLMPDGLIFQQDGAPAHRACNARLVTRHCNDFIAKHEWPSNSPDLNLLDYHVWGATLKGYHKLDKCRVGRSVGSTHFPHPSSLPFHPFPSFPLSSL